MSSESNYMQPVASAILPPYVNRLKPIKYLAEDYPPVDDDDDEDENVNNNDNDDRSWSCFVHQHPPNNRRQSIGPSFKFIACLCDIRLIDFVIYIVCLFFAVLVFL